jgi:hypothetical protein
VREDEDWELGFQGQRSCSLYLFVYCTIQYIYSIIVGMDGEREEACVDWILDRGRLGFPSSLYTYIHIVFCIPYSVSVSVFFRWMSEGWGLNFKSPPASAYATPGLVEGDVVGSNVYVYVCIVAVCVCLFGMERGGS